MGLTRIGLLGRSRCNTNFSQFTMQGGPRPLSKGLVCVNIQNAEVEGCFQFALRELVDVALKVLQGDVGRVL